MSDRLPPPYTPGQLAFEAWAQEQIGDSGYRDLEWYWESLTKPEQESWERIAQAVTSLGADGPRARPAAPAVVLKEPTSLQDARAAVAANRKAFDLARQEELKLKAELDPILDRIGDQCLAGAIDEFEYAEMETPISQRLLAASRETSARYGILKNSERHLEFEEKYWKLASAYAGELRACLENAALLAKAGELPHRVLVKRCDDYGEVEAVRSLGEALYDDPKLAGQEVYTLIPLTLNPSAPDSKE